MMHYQATLTPRYGTVRRLSAMAGTINTTAWGSSQSPNNPDAEPVLDGWGWGDYWSAPQWVIWHKANAAKYGVSKANDKFVAAWQNQGLQAEPLNARSFDTSFRAYAKACGFFDGLYYGAGKIAQPLGWGADIVNTAEKVKDKAGSGVENVAAILEWALPVAACALLYLGWKTSQRKAAAV